MINMAHDGYNRRFLLHLEFLVFSEISTIDDADDLKLHFGNYVIFWVYHLFSESRLTNVEFFGQR
jgi:hypothetical protein